MGSGAHVNVAEGPEKLMLTMCLHLFAKAAAAELRRHAKASMEDLPEHLQPAALRRAAQGNTKSAERDLHRLFRSLQMVLPIQVSVFKSGPHAIHHLKISNWFRYMLKEHAERVLGGFERRDPHASTCLRAFWIAARAEMGDHAIYELRDEELHRCIPFALHMDEGRGLRKSACLVSSAQ